MKSWTIAVAAVLVASPGLAAAEGLGNNIDAYYVSSGLDIDVDGLGSADDDGDGFGVKGQFAFANQLFVSGEYQSVSYDDSDFDLDQIRAGLGINTLPMGAMTLYGLAEYVNFDAGDGDDDSGYGVHGGLIFDLNEAISLNGRVGYVDLGDSDGVELLVGGAFKFTPQLAAFIDYRYTVQEEDDVELTVDDLRIGGRFLF